jgi:hypothetical protein
MKRDSGRRTLLQAFRQTAALLQGPPAGKCSWCQGRITEVRHVGHFHEVGGGSGYWFSGVCSACDIAYSLTLRNGVWGAWEPDAPEPELLRTGVGEDELAVVTRKLERYLILGPKWQRFLSRRRAGDEVLRYRSDDGLHTGFAIVRRGRPAARFPLFSAI